MKSQLKLTEWLGIYCIFCAVVAAIAFSQRHPLFSSPTLPAGQLAAEIEGCVRHPGLYYFEQGSTLNDLLEKGGPLPEADLKGLRRKSLLKNGQLLFIKERPLITVFLEGAVENPGPRQVRKGMRRFELLATETLLEGATLSSVKGKNQPLKENEILKINTDLRRKPLDPPKDSV